MRREHKKLVFRFLMLVWERKFTPNNADELFVAVRRVRNNLLHGGKAGDPDYDPDEPDRNEKLIREAQWVIEQALLQMEEVKDHFEGNY